MFIIGLSGLAGCGKNTFANLLEERLKQDSYFNKVPIIQESFAAQLRMEMFKPVKEAFGIDVYTENRPEKEKIRDLMITWAAIRRKESNGLYFVNKLKDRISVYDKGVCIITDLRFKEFNYDELDFIKDNGVAIHIEKYKPSKSGFEKYFFPSNKSEELNDPIIRSLSNYSLFWPDGIINDKKLKNEYVDAFMAFLYSKYFNQ